MYIVSKATLTDQEEMAVRTLIAQIKQHDGLYREPYLSSQLNFDPTMPAFFLAYEETALLGFLTVYADDTEPEILLWVHPDHRLQGVARQLFQTYETETASYGLDKPFFTVERHVLAKYPQLPQAWGVSESQEAEVEYWLGRGRTPFDLPDCPGLVVCQAEPQHVAAIAAFQSAVFDEPLEVTQRYAREAIADEKSLLYIALEGDQVLASCTVDLSSGDNYLYGLAVKSELQGQGIGTYLTQYIINDRIAHDNRPFQIAVEAENAGAKRLYERLGFEVQTEVTFLR